MARIRTVKPEFWVSEQVAECSTSARLTFIGLLNFCDDRGVHPAKPKTLKAEIFPMDDITSIQVEEWIRELIAAGLVREFEAGESGERYWHVTGWERHQKIDRPSYKHPAPPYGDSSSTRQGLGDESPNAQRGLDEDSSRDRRAPPPGMEGNGKEGNGEEKPSASSAKPTRTPSVPCPIDRIVELYHEALPDLPKVKLMTPDREKAIRKRWAWVLSSRKSDNTPRATNADEALVWFRDYFVRATDNDFLMGRGARSAEHANWRCDLDFLLTDRGMKHVIEKTQGAA